MKYKLEIPFFGAFSVSHSNLAASPSDNVTDFGNVLNTGPAGFTFGSARKK